MSQKTYKMCFFRILRVYGMCLVAEKRLRHHFAVVPQSTCFLGGIL